MRYNVFVWGLVIILGLSSLSYARSRDTSEQGIRDAQRDIKAGHYKVFQGGTEACVIYGIGAQDYQGIKQVKSLSIEGECGCDNPKAIHPDFSEDYATAYNQTMWRYLKTRGH